MRTLARRAACLDILAVSACRAPATFERPHQLSVGMKHVFVNGVEVLRDGAHTGARPGRVVRGAGWNRWRSQH